MDVLLEKFKSHIEFEEDMDDTMLNTYLASARKYVRTATGFEPEQSVLMVAALFFEYRSPEADMAGALEAINPILISEMLSDETIDE